MPGDKSIAHRWLILAATARGRSELRGLPAALDVRSTARVLAALSDPDARDALDAWASQPTAVDEGDRSTSNRGEPPAIGIGIESRGRVALRAPEGSLDCGNSGTTMRLLSGVLASCPFEARLVGDASLSSRPMERVAEPLRAMGARVETVDGHPPVIVQGGALEGIRHVAGVPSAQVKGAILFAGLEAEGETSVAEPAPTRDHTERALRHLGAPIRDEDGRVAVAAFRHEGFAATVPGDVSSAAFLLVAAALSGRALSIEGVGLNPSRTFLLRVLDRMGVDTTTEVFQDELGEPVGRLTAGPCTRLVGTSVDRAELPLLIDEIPALAMLAAHAEGETWFRGAGELRVKESDRLGGVVEALRALGGDAGVEGDDLVVAGGGLSGGRASSQGDHRMAMAIAAGAVGAAGAVTIDGMEAAEVSFPGYIVTLSALGARIET